MNPKLLRLGLFALGSMLAALGGADMAFEAVGGEAPHVLPQGLAAALGGLGTWLVGYATTAKKLGDVPVAQIEHEYRSTDRPDG